jgi:hypothetical protein
MPLNRALIQLELVLNVIANLLCRHHLLHFLLSHLALQKCSWLVLHWPFVNHLKILILARLVSVCKSSLRGCLIRLVKILIFNIAWKKHIVVHIVNSIDCWALMAIKLLAIRVDQATTLGIVGCFWIVQILQSHAPAVHQDRWLLVESPCLWLSRSSATWDAVLGYSICSNLASCPINIWRCLQDWAIRSAACFHRILLFTVNIPGSLSTTARIDEASSFRTLMLQAHICITRSNVDLRLPLANFILFGYSRSCNHVGIRPSIHIRIIVVA